MDFYAVLARVVELLQREGRTSYRAIKRQFARDDEYLADLTVELIEVNMTNPLHLRYERAGTVSHTAREKPCSQTSTYS
jgi:hypothetical protein